MRRSGIGGQRSQRSQAARTQHLLGRLRNGSKYSTHRTRLIADRTVRKREIALLGKPIALKQQQLVLRPRGLASRQHALEHRPDDVPYLRPAFLAPLSQRFWMFLAKNRFIGIIIELDQFRPPPDQHREMRRQTDTDGGAQTLRPCFDRTKWS